LPPLFPLPHAASLRSSGPPCPESIPVEDPGLVGTRPVRALCKPGLALRHFPDSFALYLFADPHPLNPVSIFCKNEHPAGMRVPNDYRESRDLSSSCNFFSCNIYGSVRKRCKQRTYGSAKTFRCNIYKKHGEGVRVMVNQLSGEDSCPDRRHHEGFADYDCPKRESSYFRIFGEHSCAAV